MAENKTSWMDKLDQRTIILLWICLVAITILLSMLALFNTTGKTIPGKSTPTETTIAAQTAQEQLRKLERENDRTIQAWFWNAGAALGTIGAALIAIFGVLASLRQTRKINRHDRKLERDKLTEERFQHVVEGLGSKDTERQVGAAIMLRTFLQPGYEQFYRQTFDLVVAHLRLRKADQVPSLSQSTLSQRLLAVFKTRDEQKHQQDTVSPIPLDSLGQALIMVFQEAFPRARDLGEQQTMAKSKEFDPRTLDASMVCLDSAYLGGIDLAKTWLPGASFRNTVLWSAILTKADLRGANLSGARLTGAHLEGATLAGAILIEAILSPAFFTRGDLTGDLRGADLRKAYLSGAFLDKANLMQADLGGAHLDEAHLIEANLIGASLNSANLSKADLRGATMDNETDLRKTKLQGAKYNIKMMQGVDIGGKLVTIEPTQWPNENFDPKTHGAFCVDC